MTTERKKTDPWACRTKKANEKRNKVWENISCSIAFVRSQHKPNLNLFEKLCVSKKISSQKFWRNGRHGNRVASLNITIVVDHVSTLIRLWKIW